MVCVCVSFFQALFWNIIWKIWLLTFFIAVLFVSSFNSFLWVFFKGGGNVFNLIYYLFSQLQFLFPAEIWKEEKEEEKEKGTPIVWFWLNSLNLQSAACLSLSVFVCLCLSFSVFFCLCLSLSIFVCLCLSLSISGFCLSVISIHRQLPGFQFILVPGLFSEGWCVYVMMTVMFSCLKHSS